jgi:RimJ/RimL family protein N-acetyltransferase
MEPVATSPDLVAPVVRSITGRTGPGGTWPSSWDIGNWENAACGPWSTGKNPEFVGVVGFAEPEGWPGFELAWTLARRWWGHGYATEAARAALAYAFDVWRKERVISLIHPDNAASIRVAERIGERLQGRDQLLGKEMLLYAVERGSYEDLGCQAQ